MTSTERRAWALALLLVPAAARAQTRDDDARRRQLILQAGALRDRGDHEGALARLRQAAARRMSPSLRLFIAQEERALARPVEALREARLCAAEFDADPSLPHRDEFLASCRGLVDELSARVGRLIVRVPDASAPGVVVTVRGEPLPAEVWGAPWELLPGRALVEASAPGRERYTREVVVAAGGSITLRVELPRVEAPARESPAPGGWRARPSRDRVDASERGAGAGPWALLAGGGASFVLAGVFYGLQGGAVDARDALCRDAAGDCAVRDAGAAGEASAHQDDASTYNALANVALGVGAAAAVGGLVWWLAAPSQRSSARAATVVFAPSAGGAFVGVRGAL